MAITLRTFADREIESHEAEWGNAAHASSQTATLDIVAYSVFDDLVVQAAGTGFVRQPSQPIQTTEAETATWVYGRLKPILG